MTIGLESTYYNNLLEMRLFSADCDQTVILYSTFFRCLEENAWDFNKSAAIFTQLKAQNQIPPEAFIK